MIINVCLSLGNCILAILKWHPDAATLVHKQHLLLTVGPVYNSVCHVNIFCVVTHLFLRCHLLLCAEKSAALQYPASCGCVIDNGGCWLTASSANLA